MDAQRTEVVASKGNHARSDTGGRTSSTSTPIRMNYEEFLEMMRKIDQVSMDLEALSYRLNEPYWTVELSKTMASFHQATKLLTPLSSKFRRMEIMKRTKQ
jgi:hypothetical protein